ncbi:trigger factor [Caldovatus aquaticus]|uniref:Glycosyltransferase n=1 Tax=Caldovatus aquaticus TaxID=2865671 RepID=A0ABS7F6S9_9PROT|nr:trigger factor [Caldovatus aquaticus]MBW8271259.1 glycosyltransferase [Caldovatus aquaticus]
MTAPPPRPLTLLALSPCPAYDPPRSGAELRRLHLYRALAAQGCAVTLLAPTDAAGRREVVHHAPGLREIRIPKDGAWRAAHATLERAGLAGDLSGLAFALAAGEPDGALRQEALRLAAAADLVVHDSPWSAPLLADAPGPRPAEAYNARHPALALLSARVAGPGLPRAFERVRRLEGDLARRCRLVLASSERDAELLRLAYGLPAARLAVCPDGHDEDEFARIRAARRRRPANARPRLLFAGSETRANLDAARFLMRDLAPALPEADIVLAGGVCAALGAASGAPPNLILAGPFDERGKQDLFAAADAYVNPAAEGPGTSLKTIEALAAGLPLIATPAGLRGLPVRPGAEAIAAERPAFAAAVRAALADPAALARIAEAGARLARDRLGWGGIAAALAPRLRAAAAEDPLPAAPPAERPLLLAVNDYAVAGVPSGGARRIREVLGTLGRELACDVVLLCFADSPGATLLAPGFLQLALAPEARHRAVRHAVNALAPVSADDIVAGLFCAANAALVAAAADLARRAAAVVLEHCYMAPLLDAVFPEGCPLPVVYSAHNVEAELKAQLLAAHPLRAALAGFAARIEPALARRADLVLACSAEDAAHFAAAGARRTLLVPNGCTPDDVPPPAPRADGAPLRVGFLGSAHPPNVEAARFILETLVPAFPAVRFEFVGAVCAALGAPAAANVLLHGVLDEAAKSAVLRGWDVALNPLAGGGGSSLKVPDYLAHGLATLCTPEGARGFALAEAGAALVVPRPCLADALAALLADAPRRRALAARAARHAHTNLSWSAACRPYAAALRDLLRRAPPPSPERRLLIVAHHGATAPGEAQEALTQLAARLRPYFARLDLAAIAVAECADSARFACRVTPAEGGSSLTLGDPFDRAVFFPPEAPPEPDAEARCRRLAQAWLEEDATLVRAFLGRLALAGRPVLVGGVHEPERTAEGGARRWTGGRFQVLLPAGSRVLELAGWSPRARTLRLHLLPAAAADAAEPPAPEEAASLATEVAQHFVLRVALPPAAADAPLLLTGDTESDAGPDDPRPRGIRLERLAVLRADPAAPGDGGGALRPLLGAEADLAEEAEAALRARDFESWAAAVLALARTRSRDREQDYAALRGPRSEALQGWLRARARDYDAVLVLGAATDPAAPRTVETLATLAGPRPRVVLRPAFRGDDRFHYWRHQLDAFARADRTLLVSRTIAGLLGGKRFAVVPDGGVDPAELALPDAAARFREAMPALREPFFLVLAGRDAEPRGDARVARAVRALRAAGREVALVRLGAAPGAPAATAEPGVHALGHPSRAVALGALACCLGVVALDADEGGATALCEAWAFRKPVVASRACLAFRDLVEDGATGLLVETDAELEEALARLLGDAGLRDRLGAAGFAALTARHARPAAARAIARALTGADRADPPRPPAPPCGAGPSPPARDDAALPDSHCQVTDFEAVGLRRRFTLVVPAGFLAAERDRRLARLPRGEWEADPALATAARRRIAAALTAEILREAVEAAFRREVQRRALRPAGGPDFERLDGGDAGGDFRLRVRFEVLPRLAVPDLSAITLERLAAEPGEAEVAAELEALARRHGALRSAPADGRAPAEEGSGDPPRGTGNGAQAPTIPRPVVDEALLARRLGLSDPAALRLRVRAALQRRYDALAQARLRDALRAALADRVEDVPVPSVLVAEEEERLREAAGEEEDAARRAERRARAERNLRVALLLAEIARSFGVSVTEAELEAAMRREAARHAGAADQAMAHFRASPAARAILRARLLEEKTMALVLRRVRVTERRVPPGVLAPPQRGIPPAAAGDVATERPFSAAEDRPAPAAR